MNDYCLTCHDNNAKEAGLSLEAIAADEVATHPDVWEKVVRKLRTRQMPPVGEPRLNDTTYDAAISSREASSKGAKVFRPFSVSAK